MDERAVEVKPVGDDILIGRTIESECTDDEVLAGARIGDIRDLRGLRVDQLREERLGVEALTRTASGSRPRHRELVALRQVSAACVSRRPGDRVSIGGVEVREPVREVEVLFSG